MKSGNWVNNCVLVVGWPTLSFVATSVAGDGTNCKRAVFEKLVDSSSTLFTGGAHDRDNFLAHNVAWLDVDISKRCKRSDGCSTGPSGALYTNFRACTA